MSDLLTDEELAAIREDYSQLELVAVRPERMWLVPKYRVDHIIKALLAHIDAQTALLREIDYAVQHAISLDHGAIHRRIKEVLGE